MTEKMIRTQVYLPRSVFDQLRRRAEKQETTLALQIREALADYLHRVETEEDDGILHADDPIFQMIGFVDSGAQDLSTRHDLFLYGKPEEQDKPA